MSRLKLAIILCVLIIFMNVRISVEGTEEEGRKNDAAASRSKHELEVVVRGAVEDQSWMTSVTEEELRSNLGRYFDGFLLDYIVLRAWDFIARPTDWYSTYGLMEMRVIYEDSKRAVAEALICIEDVDTGHNETGKGLFVMSRTPRGWKIYYFNVTWNKQTW